MWILTFTFSALLSLITVATIGFCSEKIAAFPGTEQLPVIVEGPPRHQLYRPGEAIILPCRALGQSRYLWRKDGQDLGSWLNGTGSLRIDTKSLESQGYYQCIAATSTAAAYSNRTFLQAAVLDAIETLGTTYTLSVTEGDAVLLPCNNTYSIPTPIYRWSLCIKEDFAIQGCGQGQGVTLNQTVYQLENGALILTRVSKRWERFIFKCEIYNYYLRRRVVGNYVTINVQESDNDNSGSFPKASLLYSSPSPVVAVKGQNVKLVCFFNEGASVSWHREDNGVIGMERLQLGSLGHELTIRAVRESDSATYICSTSNLYGVQSAKIRLRVEDVPRLIESPANQIVQSNSTAVFVCTATGTPEPQLEWCINGQELKNITGLRFYTNENKSELFVEELPNSSTIIVQCNASNLHGYILTTASLTASDDYFTTSPVATLSPAEIKPNPTLVTVISENIKVIKGKITGKISSIHKVLVDDNNKAERNYNGSHENVRHWDEIFPQTKTQQPNQIGTDITNSKQSLRSENRHSAIVVSDVFDDEESADGDFSMETLIPVLFLLVIFVACLALLAVRRYNVLTEKSYPVEEREKRFGLTSPSSEHMAPRGEWKEDDRDSDNDSGLGEDPRLSLRESRLDQSDAWM